MNRLRIITIMFCVSLVTLAALNNVKATEYDKKTTVTFSQQFEIPGVGQQFLPAGTYIFKLVDSMSDRDIVQITSPDGKHVFATILTIANYRLKATNKTVMTFRERATGQPEAIRAWFYPGANWGQEFVYPKARAIQLAKIAQQPVLAMPTELSENIVVPVQSVEEPPVVALKAAPIVAVTPMGEEVAVAEVIPPKTELAQITLPRTASSLPLVGFLGLLAIGTAISLWYASRKHTWNM